MSKIVIKMVLRAYGDNGKVEIYRVLDTLQCNKKKPAQPHLNINYAVLLCKKGDHDNMRD